jgi:hypothetical protein
MASVTPALWKSSTTNATNEHECRYGDRRFRAQFVLTDAHSRSVSNLFAALSAELTIREIGAQRFKSRQRRDRLSTIFDKSGSQSISFVLIRGIRG